MITNQLNQTQEQPYILPPGRGVDSPDAKSERATVRQVTTVKA
jgi:hypothetical protein